ncbi:cupin domain-containing protein [Aliiglaciecola sp. 3_MG-2023]|uniref:cupin domain-containing protein n=1 Tax=Aliiglaciecola sp. 3_MG-2023 TaxID=3062644 RepID=UPI0026E30252|nr:cupin domain-containing protein [Aliiglaciecola sp. 3_MG-2023]MDO6695418.1 cupin domain-containing protein [Aliiglaciecola sp. 3_MG-2023]
MESRSIIKHASDENWLAVLGMRLKFLCTAEETNGRYSSMLNTVPKGLGAPPHSHPWDESFYVLQGQVELRLGDTITRMNPGDYALVPANHVHGFTGLSDEEGLLITFESPSHSHSFFQEINDRVKTMPDDLYKMPDIGERHKVTFV